ncbi:MAG: acyl-CoA/acyl-ACP dehydrogenase [Planctomycetales bacterium]|nr:acyl-CoA/acyl-ACP dehydrogenase [Planctomycetales bacterium]
MNRLNPSLPSSVSELCQRLREASHEVSPAAHWPAKQIQWCAAEGVFRWFIPERLGGWGWDEQQLLAGYLALSRSCLTTTFILTQWNAACRRILDCENEELQHRLLPPMASGELFATVGISHLSTSRQHLARPVLTAVPEAEGRWRLDGYSPWVTGGVAADIIVTGASLDDGRQLLCALPTTRPGVQAHPGQTLVALTASCTDRVELQQVVIDAGEVLAGPTANVMQGKQGGGSGGLQTSTLAIGLALAAVDFIGQQAEQRRDLQPIFDKLHSDATQLRQVLETLTAGRSTTLNASELRQQANLLVLRATQAALSAAKGAGFVATHPAGRWAREALFFLVWSCPQPVVAANLCELAQLN